MPLRSNVIVFAAFGRFPPKILSHKQESRKCWKIVLSNTYNKAH